MAQKCTACSIRLVDKGHLQCEGCLQTAIQVMTAVIVENLIQEVQLDASLSGNDPLMVLSSKIAAYQNSGDPVRNHVWSSISWLLKRVQDKARQDGQNPWGYLLLASSFYTENAEKINPKSMAEARAMHMIRAKTAVQ